MRRSFHSSYVAVVGLLALTSILPQGCLGMFQNLPPEAEFNASPTQGVAPLTVSLDASGSSDPDGHIQGYDWAFGDGDRATGRSVTHTFKASGTYTVRLTVTDDGGLTDRTATTITVSSISGPIDPIPGDLPSFSPYAKIYWTDSHANLVQRADLDGSNVETLIRGSNPQITVQQMRGLALDPDEEKLYWGGTQMGKVFRAFWDGSSPELLLESQEYRGLQELGLDLDNGHLYWATQNGISRIEKGDVDYLVSSSGQFEYFTLDRQNDKIYWTTSSPNTVRRADLDGSNAEDLVTGNLGTPQGIALDRSSGHLYWADPTNGVIRRARLDGSQPETVVERLGYVRDVTVDAAAGKIYWSADPPTQGGSGIIRRANLDGSNVEDLVTSGLRFPMNIELGGQ